jgi:hypothetical protein
MSQARQLLEVNEMAVRNAVEARPGMIEDVETPLAFLESLAAWTTDNELKALVRRVSAMIRRHRDEATTLFGFRFQSDDGAAGHELPREG